MKGLEPFGCAEVEVGLQEIEILEELPHGHSYLPAFR